MPEGHTIHRIAKLHARLLAGRACFFCPKEQKAPRGVKLPKVKTAPVPDARRRTHGRNHGDADAE
jgi:hypothetical protein